MRCRCINPSPMVMSWKGGSRHETYVKCSETFGIKTCPSATPFLRERAVGDGGKQGHLGALLPRAATRVLSILVPL